MKLTPKNTLFLRAIFELYLSKTSVYVIIMKVPSWNGLLHPLTQNDILKISASNFELQSLPKSLTPSPRKKVTSSMDFEFNDFYLPQQ